MLLGFMLSGAAHCPWFFLNHNAKIQHSELPIHGFSRLLTFSHRFSRLFLKMSPEG